MTRTETERSTPDLSAEEQELLSRLRTFEQQAQQSQINEEVLAKWLFWADILRNELSYRSDFLESVLDGYVERIRGGMPAVLSLSPHVAVLAEYRQRKSG